jgi:hypothetical protein
MKSLKWLPILGALIMIGLTGCSGTQSGTTFGSGNANRSVKRIRVSSKVEVINLPKLNKRGNATYYDVVLRNNDLKRKQWELEYMFQFFDADGRELPSATKGWRQLTIGRGETKTIGGCCLISGAETALCTLRRWRRKN